MGLLTTEHGRKGYLADFVLYAVASTTLAVWLVVAAPRERWAEIMAFAFVGLVGWTFVEYALHRFVLHGLQPFRRWHAEHHRRPRALIGTPTILSATLITALVFIPALVLSDLWRASALTFGLLSGYLAYAVVHHALHHWHGQGVWLRQARRQHALHHSPVAEPARYGVTSAFWDVVFRTNGGNAGARRRSRQAVALARLDASEIAAWENEGGAVAGHVAVGWRRAAG
jgi:cyclopropane-fatty-acyl-phospholipid synthase